MKNPFLIGETIYLRSLDYEDLEGDYISWLNDQEVCEFNSHHIFPYTKEKAKSFLNVILNSKTEIVLAIVDKKNDLHVGNISLQKIDFFHQNAEIAFLLGNKDFWGKGVGFEAANLLLRHGFYALGLNRIYCGTYSTNIRMRKLAVKLGMKEEGCRRKAAYKNGQFIDIIEFGILKEEYN